MIELDESVLAKFEADLMGEWLLFEQALSRKFTDFTRAVFDTVLRGSPQWSSNLAGNWNYSVNAPDSSYTPGYDKGKPVRANEKPFSRLNPNDTALYNATAKMLSVPAPSWRDTVLISNNTPADEGGYLLDRIDDGKVRLRPENLLPGQTVLFEYTVAIHKDDIL